MNRSRVGSLEAGDTIAAIATATGAGAVGIIRLSGPSTREVMRALIGRSLESTPRRMSLATVRDARGEAVDAVLAVLMPGPDSYTGEDVAEIHGHGGSANLQRLLDACIDAGCRAAEPGEFTRRAFESGRLDLTEAEGVLALVEATSERAQRLGRALLDGDLRERIESLRERINEALALLEASIDFPEDVGDVALAPDALDAIASDLSALARGGAVARRTIEGFSVALVGPVNAGKSSLFNRLLGRERALVDQAPGTTRDYIEADVDWDGVRVTLIDTAGRRAGASDVEGRGIERGGERADDADLELWIAPASDAASVDALPSGDRHWRVWSKVDVAGAPADGHATSALTGAGIESLRAAIVERACSLGGAESALLVSERQRQLVDRALETIERARDALHRGAAAELIAADLQIAQSTLATLVGEDVSDEVLDELFARFCIGK